MGNLSKYSYTYNRNAGPKPELRYYTRDELELMTTCHRFFLCQSSEKEFHYFFITVHTDKRKNIFFLPVP